MFQNLGDGTYFHCGSLAIRQAIAAGVNITYKILYNDAVAMTGGQPVDGTLSVPQIAQQMRAEGVQAIVVLSATTSASGTIRRSFPTGVEFHDRRELDAVQKRLREVKGTSVLIYDQTCATEKRRRRKRGKMVDPQKRVFVNTLVCEGCGDCGKKSFCVSVLPKDTEFGRKREIDQSQLQQGLQLRRGLLPELRHRARRQAAQGQARSVANAAERLSTLPMPAFAQRPVAALEHPDHRRRRHRRGHHRRAARHGRRTWKARARPCSTRPAWRRRAAR